LKTMGIFRTYRLPSTASSRQRATFFRDTDNFTWTEPNQTPYESYVCFAFGLIMRTTVQSSSEA
jgi:hypothetical protein